ncbi:cytoskeletal protein RodZ [Bacillus alveayuensis]|uniref:Cytoskeletal protein RodZ n=1 Tax=Aeribacillus alveayuensis TaxID=279215 RepID=A0ABT9VSL1_9BACI|nr:cytoskeletal protein RodZ [Bacillus alveayuensis]
MRGLKERFRKLREAHGLSQMELSNELKLANSILLHKKKGA